MVHFDQSNTRIYVQHCQNQIKLNLKSNKIVLRIQHNPVKTGSNIKYFLPKHLILYVFIIFHKYIITYLLTYLLELGVVNKERSLMDEFIVNNHNILTERPQLNRSSRDWNDHK